MSSAEHVEPETKCCNARPASHSSGHEELASPIAAHENAAALARFHREIADNIQRAPR